MKKVLITREESQFNQVRDIFSKYSIEAIPFPVIRFENIDFQFNQNDFDYIIFTSSNGVKFFHKKHFLKDIDIIAVGEKTADLLKEIGYKSVIVPSEHSAEGILKHIVQNADLFYGKRFALIRAAKGVDTLIKHKPEYVEIVVIPVYKTTINIPENKQNVELMLRNGEVDFVVFSSPSTVENFLDIFQHDREIFKNTKVCVIGKTTLKKATDKGIRVSIVAEKPSFEHIAQEISKYI